MASSPVSFEITQPDLSIYNSGEFISYKVGIFDIYNQLYSSGEFISYKVGIFDTYNQLYSSGEFISYKVGIFDTYNQAFNTTVDTGPIGATVVISAIDPATSGQRDILINGRVNPELADDRIVTTLRLIDHPGPHDIPLHGKLDMLGRTLPVVVSALHITIFTGHRTTAAHLPAQQERTGQPPPAHHLNPKPTAGTSAPHRTHAAHRHPHPEHQRSHSTRTTAAHAPQPNAPATSPPHTAANSTGKYSANESELHRTPQRTALPPHHRTQPHLTTVSPAPHHRSARHRTSAATAPPHPPPAPPMHRRNHRSDKHRHRTHAAPPPHQRRRTRAQPTGNTAPPELDITIRKCRLGEISVFNFTLCERCKVGTFSLDPLGSDCQPCPDNAQCNLDEELSGIIVPDPGYFNSNPFSDQIHECGSDTSCDYPDRQERLTLYQYQIIMDQITYNKTSYIEDQCTLGYTGALAAKNVPTTTLGCQECPNKNIGHLWHAAVNIATFVMILTTTWLTLNRQEVLHTADAEEEVLAEDIPVSTIIKVFVSYLQIISGLGDLPLIGFPSSLQSMFEFFDMIVSVPGSLINIDCSFNPDSKVPPTMQTILFIIFSPVYTCILWAVIFMIFPWTRPIRVWLKCCVTGSSEGADTNSESSRMSGGEMRKTNSGRKGVEMGKIASTRSNYGREDVEMGKPASTRLTHGRKDGEMGKSASTRSNRGREDVEMGKSASTRSNRGMDGVQEGSSKRASHLGSGKRGTLEDTGNQRRQGEGRLNMGWKFGVGHRRADHGKPEAKRTFGFKIGRKANGEPPSAPWDGTPAPPPLPPPEDANHEATPDELDGSVNVNVGPDPEEFSYNGLYHAEAPQPTAAAVDNGQPSGGRSPALDCEASSPSGTPTHSPSAVVSARGPPSGGRSPALDREASSPSGTPTHSPSAVVSARGPPSGGRSPALDREASSPSGTPTHSPSAVVSARGPPSGGRSPALDREASSPSGTPTHSPSAVVSTHAPLPSARARVKPLTDRSATLDSEAASSVPSYGKNRSVGRSGRSRHMSSSRALEDLDENTPVEHGLSMPEGLSEDDDQAYNAAAAKWMAKHGAPMPGPTGSPSMFAAVDRNGAELEETEPRQQTMEDGAENDQESDYGDGYYRYKPGEMSYWQKWYRNFIVATLITIFFFYENVVDGTLSLFVCEAEMVLDFIVATLITIFFYENVVDGTLSLFVCEPGGMSYWQKWYRNFIVATFITIVFYENVVDGTPASLFVCEGIDMPVEEPLSTEAGLFLQTYWDASPIYECYKDTHMYITFIVGIPTLIVFCAGCPLASAGFLYWNFERLADLDFLNFYGFIYREYVPMFFYWESVIMARKLIFTLAKSYIINEDPATQVLVLLAIIAFSLVIHMICNPYSERVVGRLEFWQLLVTLVSPWIFSLCSSSQSMECESLGWGSWGRDSEEIKINAVGFIILVLNAALFIVFCLVIFYTQSSLSILRSVLVPPGSRRGPPEPAAAAAGSALAGSPQAGARAGSPQPAARAGSPAARSPQRQPEAGSPQPAAAPQPTAGRAPAGTRSPQPEAAPAAAAGMPGSRQAAASRPAGPAGRQPAAGSPAPEARSAARSGSPQAAAGSLACGSPSRSRALASRQPAAAARRPAAGSRAGPQPQPAAGSTQPEARRRKALRPAASSRAARSRQPQPAASTEPEPAAGRAARSRQPAAGSPQGRQPEPAPAARSRQPEPAAPAGSRQLGISAAGSTHPQPGRKPAARATAGSRNPAAGEPEAEAGRPQRQAAPASRQPAAGSPSYEPQPAAGAGRRQAQQPAAAPEPAAGSGSRSPQPAARQPEAEPGRQQQAARSRQPAAGSPQPAARSRQPAARQPASPGPAAGQPAAAARTGTRSRQPHGRGDRKAAAGKPSRRKPGSTGSTQQETAARSRKPAAGKRSRQQQQKNTKRKTGRRQPAGRRKQPEARRGSTKPEEMKPSFLSGEGVEHLKRDRNTGAVDRGELKEAIKLTRQNKLVVAVMVPVVAVAIRLEHRMARFSRLTTQDSYSSSDFGSDDDKGGFEEVWDTTGKPAFPVLAPVVPVLASIRTGPEDSAQATARRLSSAGGSLAGLLMAGFSTTSANTEVDPSQSMLSQTPSESQMSGSTHAGTPSGDRPSRDRPSDDGTSKGFSNPEDARNGRTDAHMEERRSRDSRTSRNSKTLREAGNSNKSDKGPRTWSAIAHARKASAIPSPNTQLKPGPSNATDSPHKGSVGSVMEPADGRKASAIPSPNTQLKAGPSNATDSLNKGPVGSVMEPADARTSRTSRSSKEKPKNLKDRLLDIQSGLREKSREGKPPKTGKSVSKLGPGAQTENPPGTTTSNPVSGTTSAPVTGATTSSLDASLTPTSTPKSNTPKAPYQPTGPMSDGSYASSRSTNNSGRAQ
eukprot:gene23595-9124_t